MRSLRAKSVILCFLEKLRRRTHQSVPQTDTGGWDENSKAIGRTLVKELCKMVP